MHFSSLRARIALICLAALTCSGCRGTAPRYYGEATRGFSAVLVRSRILAPTGETNDGAAALNLESEDGDERYRLNLQPGQTSLFRVEPGIYRLVATRSFFGSPQPRVRVRIQGRSYLVDFPRDVMRMEAIQIKSDKIIPLGVLEIRLIAAERGERPKVVLRFDRGIAARRSLVEDVIAKLMDIKTPLRIRNKAITWTRALEQALVKIQGEEERPPAFKPFP
ncbi:MAG: hypothetical protein HY922_09460 [Elusimicrobia bacterium]|nr:hypothetical protein [Elusimicrobiota bacterium]